MPSSRKLVSRWSVASCLVFAALLLEMTTCFRLPLRAAPTMRSLLPFW